MAEEIEVRLFDGTPLMFPAGTPDAVINRVAKRETLTLRAMAEGRQMNPSAQGFMTAIQGPMMGFADELAGAGAAATGAIANLTPWGDNKTMAENYRSARDKVRGANETFHAERPWTAGVTSALAAAPTFAAAPLRATAAAPAALETIGTAGRAVRAAGAGAGYGAVAGAGDSRAETIGGVAGDAAKGAALSAALGGTTQVGTAAIGAGLNNIAQRVSASRAGQYMGEVGNAATDRARLMLAEVLGKDAPEGADASRWLMARLRNRGADATIVDAGKQNLRQQADTLANLPGRMKNDIEQTIHQRQAGRSDALEGAADQMLGTGGRGYAQSLDALERQQRAAQAPFRDQLENLYVKADQELVNILGRVPDAHSAAKFLATREGHPGFDLSTVKVGDRIPFDSLDTVKKALWTIAEKEKVNFRATAESRATNTARRDLTAKMDDLSPKDKSGASIYQRAREAFAGPAELRDAIAAGRTAMKEDVIAVRELMDGMSQAERENFRIGALQAIRDKVGTQAGQTSLLKMWQEKSTSTKLKEIFGGNYREFAQAVARERELKKMESIGRGSQTFARFMQAGEMDAASTAASAVNVAANAHNPASLAASVVGGAAKGWNRIKTPQATRDELSRLLMLRGPEAQYELAALPGVVQRRNQSLARQAQGLGGLDAQLTRSRE